MNIPDRPTMAREMHEKLWIKNSFPVWSCEDLRRRFSWENHDPFYARHDSPEVRELELKLSMLHWARFCIATTSWEAAITLLIRSLTKVWDSILCANEIFWTTKNNFKRFVSNDGREIHFTPLVGCHIWRELIEKQKPKIIFVESPSNPLTLLADIKRLRELIDMYEFTDEKTWLKYKTKLVVDSTFIPATIQKPLRLWADLEIVSATKFIDWQWQVTGGYVATNSESDYKDLFSVRNESGLIMRQIDALVLEEGLRTLEERVRKQSQNAMLLAKMLSNPDEVTHKGRELITRVLYLWLENNSQYQLAREQFDRDLFGSIIAFEVFGNNIIIAQIFADATWFQIRPNLGLVHTIITHPAWSTHFKLSPEERIAAWVTDWLLRLSVWTEDLDKLIHCLRLWLNAVIQRLYY